MSMLKIGRDKPEKQPEANKSLPRVAVPPAPTPSRSYDQQALNFAQRLIDDQAEMERLKVDLDTWRGRALAAEEQMRRLEERINVDRKVYDEHVTKITDVHDREIAKLSAARQQDVDRLTEERDRFKLRHARTEEGLQIAGKIVLDLLKDDPLPSTPTLQEPREPPKEVMENMEAEIAQVMGAESQKPLDRAGAGEDKPIQDQNAREPKL